MESVEWVKQILGSIDSNRNNTPVHPRFIILGALGAFGLFGALPASAAPASLTLQYKHSLFTLSARDMQDWQRPQEEWTLNGRKAIPPASFRIDGDNLPPLPAGWERHTVISRDQSAIMETLRKKVSAVLDRQAGAVTISRSSTGSIVFTGLGLPGRKTDLALAANLVNEALERGISHITLPVEETDPAVTVTDPDLQKQGIKEFVTVGQSDYTGSPVNRRHNIGVGIARFNGTLIPKDTDFSFVKVLGPVDAKAGYRKELVIKGDRTEPDYGGGLCQISTTAYRGVWEYGFPILKRRNHSYSVHYYSPSGTDATVYPGSADMVFRNDSPAALLMQTFAEDGNAYFIYYGTRDDRKTELVGPFVTGGKPAPPPRTELTIEIPPGTKQKVGSPVPGLYAEWFRVIKKDGKEIIDHTSSIYEARPLYTLIGVTLEELPPPEIVPPAPLYEAIPVF